MILTVRFNLQIYSRDTRPEWLILDEEVLLSELSNSWEKIYNSFDGSLYYEFDAAVIITYQKKVFDIGDYFQNLFLSLCINVPTRLLQNEVAVFGASDSNFRATFARQDDEVFVTPVPYSRDLEAIFPYAELVAELFNCGKRMLRFYEEFWRLAGVESHPSLEQFEKLLAELQHQLQENGLLD